LPGNRGTNVTEGEPNKKKGVRRGGEGGKTRGGVWRSRMGGRERVEVCMGTGEGLCEWSESWRGGGGASALRC